MEIYIQSGDRRLGPYTVEQINQGLQRGTFSADSALAWYEGFSDQILLKDIPGIVIPPSNSKAPPPPPPPPPPSLPPMSFSKQEGDATGGIIPYKNPHALTAYYMGVFSVIPVIGVVLAIPAIILGISGLRKRKRNPVIKGSVHAWIGIGLGSISMMCAALVILLIVLLS